MLLVLCFVLLAILFVLPFIPAAREIGRKDDAAPLFINMNYCKDPRYFAVSFRKLMLKSIGDMPPGLHAVKLSKQETVQISDNARNISGTVTENILYSLNDIESENNVTFIKEVYARGNVFIGESNRLQALACDGDVHVKKGTRFLRWLDAEGNVKIDEDCQLGVSTTCVRRKQNRSSSMPSGSALFAQGLRWHPHPRRLREAGHRGKIDAIQSPGENVASWVSASGSSLQPMSCPAQVRD